MLRMYNTSKKAHVAFVNAPHPPAFSLHFSFLLLCGVLNKTVHRARASRTANIFRSKVSMAAQGETGTKEDVPLRKGASL